MVRRVILCLRVPLPRVFLSRTVQHSENAKARNHTNAESDPAAENGAEDRHTRDERTQNLAHVVARDCFDDLLEIGNLTIGDEETITPDAHIVLGKRSGSSLLHRRKVFGVMGGHVIQNAF